MIANLQNNTKRKKSTIPSKSEKKTSIVVKHA